MLEFLHGFAFGFAWFGGAMLIGAGLGTARGWIAERRERRHIALAARCRAAYDRSTYSGEYIYGKN